MSRLSEAPRSKLQGIRNKTKRNCAGAWHPPSPGLRRGHLALRPHSKLWGIRAEASKFLDLSSAEKILLFRVWILLGITRLCLSVFRFPILRKILTGIGPFVVRVDKEFTDDQLVRIVGIASRYAPKATCLAQALTVQLLLKQSGRQASLHIGVNGVEGGHLDAHAWVESSGKVITGGPNPREFTPLLTLE
jgi:hypothetical protein